MTLVPAAGAWVRGWAHCRGYDVADLPGGWRVLLHDHPAREVEVVLAAPSAETARARLVGLPERHWVTLLDPPAALDAPPGVALIEAGEVLQVLERLPPGPVAVPDVRVSLQPLDDDAVAARVEEAGEVIASGLGSCRGGALVVDSIVTARTHRRQGLGSAVMGALTAWGRGAGATHGVLVATPDGQALYGRLGWRTAAVVHTYARR